MDKLNIAFNSISAICLIIATFLTYRNFVIIKSLENENHFYKYKMESAQKLIISSMTLINQFQDIMTEVYILNEQKSFDANANTSIDTKIDLNFDVFRKSIIENSLFLPQNIMNEIEKFYEMFLEEIDFEGSKEDVENYFDNLLDKIESINGLIRKDLGVENLNIKLKKRLKI